MGKAAVVTPLYIAGAWILLISYQLFTETAVSTVVQKISVPWPSIGGWLSLRIDLIVFVHAFAWIWVLTSMTPSVILGRRTSMFTLFVFCLVLTFVAISGRDILPLLVGREYVDRVLRLAVWLEKNMVLASLYLLAPYLVMLAVDVCGEEERRPEEEPEEPEGVLTEELQLTEVERAEAEALMQSWQSKHRKKLKDHQET